MERHLDFSRLQMNGDLWSDPRVAMLKYYEFSPAERTRPRVKIADGQGYAEILDRGGFVFHRQEVASASERAFVARLKNMLVGPGGIVTDPELRRGYYYRGEASNCGPNSPARPYVVHQVKKVFPLLVQWGWSWQHFVQDLLDILVFAQDILLDQPDLPILVDGSPRFPHFEQLVRQVLGLRNPLVTFRHQVGDPNCQEVLLAEEVILANFHPVKHMGDLVPQAVRWVRQALIRQDPPLGHRDKVIYISRADASAARRVPNEGEVLEHLGRTVRALNPAWEVVRFSPPAYDLGQTMELFQRARAVVCLHGGGSYNFLFAPPQTVVIECVSAQHPTVCCHNLSGALGHDYWVVPLAGVSHYDPSVELPAARLAGVLEGAILSQSVRS